VQILDPDHRRPVRGELAEQFDPCGAQALARLPRMHVRVGVDAQQRRQLAVPRPDLLGVLAAVQAEPLPRDLSQRPVGDRPPVGQAAARVPPHARAEPLAQHGQQAGLADAGVADDRGKVRPFRAHHAVPCRLQQRQLIAPADERPPRAATPLRGRERSDEPTVLDRKAVPNRGRETLADEDRPVGSGGGELRRHAHGRAGHGAPLSEDLAALNPDAHGDIRLDALARGQRGPHGAVRVILLRHRRTERRQQRPADAPLDLPAHLAHRVRHGRARPFQPRGVTLTIDLPDDGELDDRDGRELALATGRCRRRRRWRRLKRRVVGEDRALELAQPRSGLQSELLVQAPARLAVHRQRLHVPPGGIQRAHALLDQPLAQRSIRRPRVGIGQHRLAVPEPEIGLVASLDRVPAQRLQPRDLRLRERLIAQVRERRPAPQAQRRAKRRRRPSERAVGQLPLTLLKQPLKALGIELTRTHLQAITGRRGHQDLRIAQRRAQPRHVHTHRLDRPRRRLLTPQPDRQALRTDRLVRVQHQQRQQRPPLAAAHRHQSGVRAHQQRTEDEELHRSPRPRYRTRRLATRCYATAISL
jgi:hypothetical protein